MIVDILCSLSVVFAYVWGWHCCKKVYVPKLRKTLLQGLDKDISRIVCEFGPTYKGEKVCGVKPIQDVNTVVTFSGPFKVDGFVLVLNVPELNWWGVELPLDYSGEIDIEDKMQVKLGDLKIG